MKQSKYTKAQRIFAMTGVILLVLLYMCTLIFALLKNDYSRQLFTASIAATIAIPLMIHFFMMMTNIRRGKKLFDNPYPYRDQKDDEESEKK